MRRSRGEALEYGCENRRRVKVAEEGGEDGTVAIPGK